MRPPGIKSKPKHEGHSLHWRTWEWREVVVTDCGNPLMTRRLRVERKWEWEARSPWEEAQHQAGNTHRNRNPYIPKHPHLNMGQPAGSQNH